jgi:ABC-type phosphate transport system substrate-binding protein
MRHSFVNRVVLGSVSAFALGLGVAGQAGAVDIFGGGATFPQVSAREIFNCYGDDVDTAANDFSSPGCIAPVGDIGQYFYAPVGSGNGLRSYTQAASSRLGIPATTVPIPYADNGTNGVIPSPLSGVNFSFAAPTGYGAHHFSLSEAPLFRTNTSDGRQSLRCYEGDTTADASCTTDLRTVGGAAKQIPLFASGVGIQYNTPNFAGTLRLSEESFCGIFTGSITKWDDARITADNGVDVSGGTGADIRVVTRADSSGTTFVFTNGLNAVCDGTRGNLYTGGAVTSPEAFPPKTFFFRGSGNSTVAIAVAAQRHAIGYVSNDFSQTTQPILRTSTPVTLLDNNGAGPNSITIQANRDYSTRPAASVENLSGAFVRPGRKNVTAAVGSLTPPTGAAKLDPENWAIAGLQPDPAAANAYPFSGFAWFLPYTCYANADVARELRELLVWTFSAGRPQVKEILNLNGAAEVSASWRAANQDLISGDANTRIRAGGAAPNCTGIPGVL